MEKTADRSTGSLAADTLPEAVTRALTAYWSLAEAGQIPPAIGGEIAVRIHSDCAVARVPAWAGRPRAFLKMFREQTALQREVEGLRRGGSVAPDSPVAVPKVLQVVPAENAVFVEYVQGRPLDAQLRRGLIDPSVHVGHVWRPLGAWLRDFHGFQPVGDEPALFLHWQLARIEGYLAELHGVLGARWVGELQRLEEAMVQRLGDRGAQLVPCHFDFALHNVMLTRDRIWVTDFAYARAAPPELDLERWWDSLEAAIGFFPATGRLQGRIRRKFIEGYGRGYAGHSAVADLIHLGLKLMRLYGLSRPGPRPIAPRVWRSYLLAQTRGRLRAWTDAGLSKYRTRRSLFVDR